MRPSADDGPFAILGLGLIGGSIARDLAAGNATVLGFDADRRAMSAARRARVITGTIDGSFERIREARTVILAVPVDAAELLLERAAPFLGHAKLITDAGSTKRAIVARAESLGLGVRFVGSHPLAGDHRSGWNASRRGLFGGATVFVCRARSSSATAVRRARSLWRSLGARPVELSAAAHDAKLAYTSHLPHLLSAALARTLDRADHARAALGSGGRDVTRLASSSPEMWSAIVGSNGAPLTRALAAFERELAHVRRAAASGDSNAIRELFTATRSWAER
jgi:prephenate dehydrogenase